MAEGTTPEEEAYKRKQEYKAYLHKHGAYEHGAARRRPCLAARPKAGRAGRGEGAWGRGTGRRGADGAPSACSRAARPRTRGPP